MDQPEQSTVQIADHVTVGELAEELKIPVTQLITELMKNGVMATVNERIDFDTAQIIVEELGLEVTLEKKKEEKTSKPKREKRASEEPRPPIVAVMGHVDHGKTTLLDAIRGSKVVEDEAGGITQHISAYQVVHNGRKITFLDTPGHEAFATLREHGADLTDLAIIVVAADDGVKPQTREAIKFAERAGVKMLVALNKIDKEGANANRVLQELADNNLMPEAWGGDTIVVEVSALKNKGIDNLLDMAFLQADVEELTADNKGPAEGLVIEAHSEKGRGPVVSLLVEQGKLSVGDIVVAGGAYGRVRTMASTLGESAKSAGPSAPAVVTGFKSLPNFGDVFKEVKNEKEARRLAEAHASGSSAAGGSLEMTGTDLLARMNQLRDSQELPVIIRADVKGSLTSVIEAIGTIKNEKISARVIGSGVGNVSENDVTMAATSNAVIYGFNVTVPTSVKQLAQREGVQIKVYKVIYELLDDLKDLLEELMSPDVVETEVGKLKIKGIFRVTQKEIITGGEVVSGIAKPSVKARVLREDEQLAEVDVIKVQQQTQEVKEVKQGELAGLELKTEKKLNLKEGDYLEFFTREEVKRTL
ncbi:MAG: translation initiation factor IF-2 [Candidatus Saccharimonadales bacterium]|nr:translation initiation factor IF-2 [Candidatus Saccharimonadales bacterium]